MNLPALRTARVLPLLLLLGLGFPRLAGAEDLYVEGGGVARRADAERLEAAARQAGLEVEVVRRFRRGVGWEFVVRVEGIEEREQAFDVAGSLAAAIGESTRVYVRAGRDVLPLGEVAGPGGGPTAASEPPQAAEGGDPVEGTKLLAAVRRAHGAAGTALVRDASQVHFRFERRLGADGEVLRVWHDYWRSGGVERLEVRVIEGTGRESLALVRPGEGAWLRVDGTVHPVEPGPTREALAAFRPEVVLARVLELAEVQDGPVVLLPPWSRGDGLDRLRLGPGGEGPAWVLGVDRNDHRIREVSVVGAPEPLTVRYADYRELEGGLVVPWQIEVWRGEVLHERVNLLVLEVPAAVDAALLDQGRLVDVAD